MTEPSKSIEALAEANRLHPKVVRLALRLAFLSPEMTSGILEGNGLSLGTIPKLLPLSWAEHPVSWLRSGYASRHARD